jgi:hypothetical protein
VSLTPVTRFEGVWALPDGKLRAFERRGEQVAMFVLDDAAGERRFERFFEFVGADAGLVAFSAAEDHVDPRAPDEPSCHTRLAAEYTYDLERDALTRRQERAQVDFDHGHCALRARSWGEAIALRRLAADGGGDWVESTAGAGNPANAKIDEPLVPQVPVPQEELDKELKKAPSKKRPQKAAPPVQKPVPPPQQQREEPPPQADVQNQQAIPPTKE